jgi:hypothetical protein
MGKIQHLSHVVNNELGAVQSARIMPIMWGSDHRAMDATTMMRFSNLWKSYCKNLLSMMFAMR